jgi:hypothetical protein
VRLPGAVGTVVVGAGIAPGLTNLVAADLLATHPDADEVEIVFTLSIAGTSGPHGARFVHRHLTAMPRHETIEVPLPPPSERASVLASPSRSEPGLEIWPGRERSARTPALPSPRYTMRCSRETSSPPSPRSRGSPPLTAAPQIGRASAANPSPIGCALAGKASGSLPGRSAAPATTWARRTPHWHSPTLSRMHERARSSRRDVRSGGPGQARHAGSIPCGHGNQRRRRTRLMGSPPLRARIGPQIAPAIGASQGRRTSLASAAC